MYLEQYSFELKNGKINLIKWTLYFQEKQHNLKISQKDEQVLKYKKLRTKVDIAFKIMMIF